MGVLLPLLWSLLVKNILKKTEEEPAELTASVDYVSLRESSKCLSTLSSSMSRTLYEIELWAAKGGLNMNAKLVLFAKKKIFRTDLDLHWERRLTSCSKPTSTP